MSVQIIDLRPAENTLSRARAGLLPDEEPLVLRYIGPAPESAWPQLFHSDNVQEIYKSKSNPVEGILIPSYVADLKDKYPCMIYVTELQFVVNGRLTYPDAGSVIVCTYKFRHNDLLITKYTVHDIAKKQRERVTRTFSRIETKIFKTDEDFLKNGLIFKMLSTVELSVDNNLERYPEYLHLGDYSTSINLENPRFARCILTDAESGYNYFNILYSSSAEVFTSEFLAAMPSLLLVTNFLVDDKHEIYLKCRRVSFGRRAVKSSVIVRGIPMSQLSEWYRQEAELNRMLARVKVKLETRSVCEEVFRNRKDDAVTYTFTRVDRIHSHDVYNVQITFKTTMDSTKILHRFTDASETYRFTCIDATHQAYRKDQLAKHIRREAYSKMVKSATNGE